MARCTVITNIAAPTEKVFALFSDVDQLAGRIKGITKVEKLTPGPVGVGTRFRETRVMFGREATEEMTFTAFEPNRSYTLGCLSCGASYSTVHRFEPDGGGTRVTMDFEARPVTFLAKLMSPLAFFMMGSLKKCLQQDVDDLKAIAEGQGPPA